MNCSISGELPDEPVVSIKSGYLFEKRLIEEHISEHGNCPITGEVMTMDDIIPLKSAKVLNPTPISFARMPGRFGIFQIEWDALMLSNMTLEKQLHTARQELNRAVYQNDAACRVISRLQKEKNEARSVTGSTQREEWITYKEKVPGVSTTSLK